MNSEQHPTEESAALPDEHAQASDDAMAPNTESESGDGQHVASVVDVDVDVDVAVDIAAAGDAPEVAAPVAAQTEESDIDGPSVDELEGRLTEVERAMGHLQSGDLDDAESAIASLDQRTAATSD
jgi:hypothetical protein